MQTFYEPGQVTKKFFYDMLSSLRKSYGVIFHDYELEVKSGTVPNRRMTLGELQKHYNDFQLYISRCPQCNKCRRRYSMTEPECIYCY